MNFSTDQETERRRFEELMNQLSSERSRLAEIRSSYATITRSRFHALRMFWFALKELAGRSSPDDVYAALSPGLAGALPLANPAATDGAAQLLAEERKLVRTWSERMRERPPAGEPTVTVVIPVYDNRAVTVRCLQSIADTWFDSLAVQFVVVDDGSTDATGDVVTRLPGVDYVRSGANEGFIRAVNRGAALARGTYLCLLNNDTVVRNGWLDHLVTTAENDQRIGIVGAKLVYPDGRLQEAGGIVWRDGSGWNFGRSESADDPRYNFVRDVDYVSGAALLVRTGLFRELGGLSERYRPAYYEDTDLCFAARERGYRVVYQPLSEVVHYEGLTSGDAASGVKRYQEINRSKFRERWSDRLAEHFENHHANVYAAARRQRTGEVVLVVDSFVPLYDRESGSQRLFHVVRLLRKLGYRVVFLPDNYAGLQPYTRELQQMGVEVLHHVEEGGRSMREALDAALPELSFAWISRPEHFQKYAPLVRRNAALKVFYDTVDLVHVRKRRKAEVTGDDADGWQAWQRIELECAAKADATIVVTDDEKTVLEALGVANVHVIPNVHEPDSAKTPGFDDRSGLLFIGNYSHQPNVDAVEWLCGLVMPRVWEQLPDVALTLVGSNVPDAIANLRSPRIHVTGQVRDASPYFRQSRAFVAPLRYGAGMKGKIGHALSYRLPIVTTPIGAEGFEFRDGENALVVEADAAPFAEAIVRLYRDRALWDRFAAASLGLVEPFSPDAVARRLQGLFKGLSIGSTP